MSLRFQGIRFDFKVQEDHVTHFYSIC